MMSPPLVSVLVPAYNAERLVRATLDSVLAQTYPNVEILAVDDGSTDSTLEVLHGYEARGVRVIAQANAGASAARNHAFRESRGAWIQFLDADDLLAPDKIEVQMARLAGEPEGTVASARWGLIVGEVGLETAEFQEDSSDWRDFEPASGWLVHSWMHRKLMFPGVWLYPRTLVEEAGLWDERISLNDDGEFNSRVLLTARKIAFCRDACAYYRTGQSASLSMRKDSEAVQSLFLSYVLSETHLFAQDNSEEARRAMARRWKEAAYELYADPRVRPIARYAELRARQLGDYRGVPSFSRRFNQFQRVFGWKAAVHAQRLVKKLGLQGAS